MCLVAACTGDGSSSDGIGDGQGELARDHAAPDRDLLDEACGNGILDPGEECDDGNVADRDGCSAACTLELVARFSFAGAVGNEPTFAAEISDPALLTVPEIGRGLGVTPSVAAEAFSSAGWTSDAAPDPDDYYRFTLAPAAGQAMRLVTLQLDERRSAAGVHAWSVRSSLDGFASDLAVVAVPDDVLIRTHTIALPSQFHDLTAAVEFRLFGFQAEFPGGTWRVDNVLVLGEVVPACGNGALDPGEACDDGNTVDHDGCSAACTLELVTRFSFPGGAGTEVTASADASDPLLAAVPVMSRGIGVAPSVAADAFSSSGWTINAALDPDDYYSFTVAPAPGVAMTLVGLQLDERRSATGIRSWSVRSSLDGFASDLAVIVVPDDLLFRTQTVALPPQFQGLVTAVEFRLYGYQAEFSGGTWRLDNVGVIGELAPTCGNGTLDPDEACDDGNTADHDGCSSVCGVELVAQFAFPGAAGNEVTFAADASDPLLADVPVMSRGPGLAPSVAADAFSATGWTVFAPDPSGYFSFIVTPAIGATLHLTALQLDERRSATGIRSWSLRSSLDGFALDLAVVAVPDDVLFRTATIALPPAFHALASAVELRLFGSQSELPSGSWRVDNVRLIGGVSGP